MMLFNRFKKNILRKSRWTLLSIASGFLAGLASTLFLISLQWVTNTRNSHPDIIWGLPIAGLLIGLFYFYFGNNITGGNNLILEEIHDPKKVLPILMVPFVFAGTILTHLFGGSAGREGTAVQMGATLSDQLSKIFKVEVAERKILLAAGAGAGFGAAIGAPLAGMIFGMEVIHVGRLKLFALFECFIASFVGYYTAYFLGAPHSQFLMTPVESYDMKTFLYVILAGLVFGLTAQLFSKIVHLIESVYDTFLKFPPLRPFFGGVLLISLYNLEGSYRFAGLGIQFIQEAFQSPSNFNIPAFKTGFTALTVGSGFKGGEFIPLVFIGSTLGSALSTIIPISFKLLAALGFSSVFAGASNTPIACSLMAAEIFGYRIFPYALVACFSSYYTSGNHGIYKSQKVYLKKHQLFNYYISWLGELPKRFLK